MKCPICNGRGTVGYYHIDHFVDIECDRCHGQGEVSEPMTNEEWLRTCSTEELAEFIRKQRDDWSDGWYSDCHRFEEIIEWLKEKHE